MVLEVLAVLELRARGLEWLRALAVRCIRHAPSRLERAEVRVDLDLRRDLDLGRAGRDSEIVRERLREVACCHPRKQPHRIVRHVRDSVAAELRGTRRTRKSR